MSRMPRASARGRGSELPQRLSPRPAFQQRTSSSESDPLHNRPIVDRSPKLGDRRSPRGTQSESLHKKKVGTPESLHLKKQGTPESLHQKKLGTRVSDLESQLGQAQEELKKLKDQLVTAESAKKEAQEELEKKKPIIPNTEEQPLPPPLASTEIYQSNEKNSNNADELTEEVSRETDVFEVPLASPLSESKTKSTDTPQQEDSETKRIEKCTDPPLSEPEKPSSNDLVLLNDEINLLKVKLGEKVEEVEALHLKNNSLNVQITEAAMTVASAQAKEEVTVLKLSEMGKELEKSLANGVKLCKELETMEEAKAALESEMKKLRVQTEQWRKAADAAAAVLSGEMEMNGRRVGERCGSMEKHLDGGVEFDPMWNDDFDDAFEAGKKKASGIKMFGDLWKKKGQK